MAVFVVHPISVRDIDISEASYYGEIQYVGKRYVYSDELEGELQTLPRDVLNRMLKAIDGFDPERDYLLIAGDHLQIVAMSALLADRWGSFKVLRYDRKAGGYVSITIGNNNDFGPS